MGKTHAVALGVGALATGVVAGACALVAPRFSDEELEARWDELRAFRYAHRGLHDNQTLAPENSLAAFRLAREAGYGSELDVHLTEDGVPVVVHDADLFRVYGVHGLVEDKLYLTLGSYRLFGTSETIPTLEEVVEVYEKGQGMCPPLIVELKTCDNNAAELTATALEVLDRHAVPYCIESFDPRVLWWLRRNRPDVFRGQLSEFFPKHRQSPLNPVEGFLHASLVGNVVARPDFIAYHYEDRRHPSVYLACDLMGAHRAYWTITSAEELAECEQEDAIAIFEGFDPITDYAE